MTDLYDLLAEQEKVAEMLLDLESKQQTNTKTYQTYSDKWNDLQEKIENEQFRLNQWALV
jgi:hypothetical protein